MSASRQHKKRIEEKAQAALNPSKKKKTNSESLRKALTGTIVTVLLLLLVFLFLSGLGFFQANLTVLKVGDVDIKGTEFNLHYFAAISSEASLYQSYGLSVPFDTTTPLKKQAYSETTSWADYFEEQAITTLTTSVIQSEQAKAEGITLTDEDYDNIQSNIDAFTEAAANANASVDETLRSYYGRGMTLEKYRSYLERETLSNRYKTVTLDSYNRTEQDLTDYYDEHRDDYDIVEYHTYSFDKEPSSSDDHDYSEEELEAYKNAQKAKADEMLSKVTSSEKFFALSKEYTTVTEDETTEDEGEDAEEDDTTVKSAIVKNLVDPFSEFLGDAARKAGDKSVLEDDDKYYVVLFNSRSRNETQNVDVRHILIKFPETKEGEEVSAADNAATKTKADTIFAEWEAGDKSSESFIDLAKEKSEDTGSKEDGGLIPDFSPTSNYVQPFLDWSFAGGRKLGDAGVIETQYGYHVMYLDKFYPPQWQRDVKTDMNNADYDENYKTLSENKEAKTNALGMYFTKSI